MTKARTSQQSLDGGSMRVAASIAVSILAGCTLERSLGSSHLDLADASSVGIADGQTGQPIGTVAYAHLADALLDTPDGLLFLGRVKDGQPLPAGGSSLEVALMRLTHDGYATVAPIPYESIHAAMARDEDAVYVAVQFPESDPYGGSAPRQGIVAIDNTTHALRVVTSGWEQVKRLAVGSQAIYLTQSSAVRDMGRLIRIDPDGSNPRVLIADLDSPEHVRVDANYVYVADDLNHRVLAVATTGDPRVLVVANGVNRPFDVVPFGSWLYITERGDTLSDGRISRVPLPPPHAVQSDLATTAQVLVSGIAQPSELAFSDEHVYWTGYSDGLHRAPLDGGASELVVPSYVQGCGPIAAHDGSVYFTSRSPNNVGSVIYRANVQP